VGKFLGDPQEVTVMRWAALSLATFPATWVLMLFWNTLGMRLDYWGTFPLGASSVLLVGALASVMSMTVDPVEAGPGETPAEGEALSP
jgi:hypothetical protein